MGCEEWAMPLYLQGVSFEDGVREGGERGRGELTGIS